MIPVEMFKPSHMIRMCMGQNDGPDALRIYAEMCIRDSLYSDRPYDAAGHGAGPGKRLGMLF